MITLEQHLAAHASVNPGEEDAHLILCHCGTWFDDEGDHRAHVAATWRKAQAAVIGSMSAPQQSAQDVLVAHAQRYDEDLTHPYLCACGWTCDEEDIDYSLPGDPGEQWDRLHAAHQLDALTAAGYAIVALTRTARESDVVQRARQALDKEEQG